MTLVSNLISFDSISIDARVQKTFGLAVNAVQDGAAVSLTSIGRKASKFMGIAEKHAIKRIDRLVGYDKLACVRKEFYSQFCCHFSHLENPLVLVDWAHIDNNKWCLLRASIALDGRACTLYEQIHPEKKMNSHACHVEFLTELKSCLPAQCKPIICTDAGFKVPWFKEVEKHGWYWVGRIRGTVKLSIDSGDNWKTPKALYTENTAALCLLPDMMISKASQHASRAVIFKGEAEEAVKKKTGGKKKAKKKKCKDYLRYKKAYEDPWLLASNLPTEEFSTENIVNFYMRRMTIEESFRDSKNEYYGLGLRRCKSTTIKRLQVILLILLVAQWELYVIGKAAENKGLQRFYQANTIKHRRVLSYCFLACRIIENGAFDFTEEELMMALKQLIELAARSKESYGDP